MCMCAVWCVACACGVLEVCVPGSAGANFAVVSLILAGAAYSMHAMVWCDKHMHAAVTGVDLKPTSPLALVTLTPQNLQPPRRHLLCRWPVCQLRSLWRPADIASRLYLHVYVRVCGW